MHSLIEDSAWGRDRAPALNETREITGGGTKVTRRQWGKGRVFRGREENWGESNGSRKGRQGVTGGVVNGRRRWPEWER